MADLENYNNQKALCLDDTMVRKTLGVFWRSSTDDVFYLIKPFPESQQFTKRVILSQVAQLFDPFGLIGPVIIRAKIFMQQLWKSNVGWDEAVPQNLQQSWIDFRNELHCLNSFSAPRKVKIIVYKNRFIKIVDQATHLQLHGFCDASESAYGACIYILEALQVNLNIVLVFYVRSHESLR